MINSLLMHFDGTSAADAAIEFGVGVAARCSARVRGLTLLDTRRLTSLTTCEAATYCNRELTRLSRVDIDQGTVRSRLSQACLDARVDFDVRRVEGNPLELLPRESQFHDLTITALPLYGEVNGHPGLQPAEVLQLLWKGVHPLLVMRGSATAIRRVLLVSDGQATSHAAIRTYLKQQLFPEAELRLLAIHESPDQGQDLLRELTEYARHRRQPCESGWLRGSARKSLVYYAQKWQADLVVTGVTRQNPLLRPLWPQPAEQILRNTNMALYATA